MVSVGGHLHVNEAVDDVEWDDVSFKSVYVLCATYFHRAIVYLVLVVLNLPA